MCKPPGYWMFMNTFLMDYETAIKILVEWSNRSRDTW